MHFSELMAVLSMHAIGLQLEEDDLVILGDDDSLDSAVFDSLVVHKAELLKLVARNGGEWLSPALRITPQMLPLANLDQATIDRIVEAVPGGAGNVQDIYPLAPLQEGILYHHIAAQQGDPYVLQTQFAFASRARFDEFTSALQKVVDRHDILRTSVIWEGLDEPVQVVWRQARLALAEIDIDPVVGSATEQLRQRFDPRHYRLDISQAPLLRLAYAEDPLTRRISAMLLFHHIAIDHAALEGVQHEIHAHLHGQAQALEAPIPYRNYVAQARLGVSQQEHEAFFREMLGDVDEPSLPFGLQDVRGLGSRASAWPACTTWPGPLYSGVCAGVTTWSSVPYCWGGCAAKAVAIARWGCLSTPCRCG